MSDADDANTATKRALENGDETHQNSTNGIAAIPDEPQPVIKQEIDSGANGSEPKRIKLEPPTNNGIEAKRDIIVVPPTKPQLFYTPLKTGLVYDVRMRYHAKIFTSYYEYIDPHPEDPRRIYRIYKKLAEAGLIQDSSLSGSDDIGPLMVKIPIREATSEEILEVHSESHLKFIQDTETMTRDRLMEETEKGDSIYVNNDSYMAAKLSCGGTIEACKAVIEGKVKNSLAVVRPPGHHAEPDTPGGFCIFSNVAVATKNILKSYPESVRKIVIVDWDVHHGNGTQKAFFNDPRVLYISVHRYENGKFYPGTKYGGTEVVGEGAGEGFNINIPWRNRAMGDADYLYAFNKVVIPAINEFNPDLVIVSAGFDAADGDLIGGCHVTPAGYGCMTHMLKGIAKGKLAVILEGGYNLDATSLSALAVAKVLVGEPPENTISNQPSLEAIEVIDEVKKVQSKYWKSLRYGVPSKTFDDLYDIAGDNTSYKLINVSEPVRAFQFNELFNKYSFTNIPIIPNFSDSEQTKSFTTDIPSNLEDVVLASPAIYDSTAIIITIHDPPDIWANLNPINGNIEGNSSVILEHPLTQIMEKVQKENEANVDQKIGYIDINIPTYQLTIPGGTSLSSNYNPTIFSQELLLYIWDNYIAYFSNLKKVVFVGFGDAYQAIVHLFGKRPSLEVKELVKGTVVFVNRSNLKALVPMMDESMIDWFYQNSVIFTSLANPCWAGSNGPTRNGTIDTNVDEGKRPRRKFGRVLKTSADGLYDVINEKFDEGMDFVLDSIEEFSSSDSN